SDATILMSHPPSTFIYYFDDRSNYIRWQTNDFSFGFWTSSPYVSIMTFGGKWRITIANSYCHWLLDEPKYAQQDSCSIVGPLDRMFRYLGTYPEYRKGNVFKLARGVPPPRFIMPRTKTSIDELLAAMAKARIPDQRQD